MLSRPTMEQTYLNMARELAKRSTCRRLHVAAIVTTWDMQNIVALGYNGPEHHGPNTCRGTEPGHCGCIHAEMNAIIKAPYDQGDLIMFSTHSPCHNCAMLLCQSRIRKIFYTDEYRIIDGVHLLRDRGIIVNHLLGV